MTRNITDDLTIVLAGEAGQGIQSIESILASLLKRSGYHFYSTSEFMSRVRGGTNSTSIRVASTRAAGFSDRIDILIPLHNEAVAHLRTRMTADTIIVGEADRVRHEGMIDVPFTQIATDLGGALFANTVAAGFICGLLKIDEKECEDFILGYYSSKSEDVRQKNLLALQKGYAAAERIPDLRITIEKNAETGKELILSGADSIALGALAGGCDYVCGYPMSPATSVLEKMASFSKRHDIIVEQVEDEVGVINMALGAWYAGARAFVSTSGGGFALMSEGVSLAGMIESPLVLHLAQRPGPATGLPTRTEQGDLDLVLYAGHGDFPRIILAPGTLEEGFTLTRKAFDLADRYQVPVFILTDQYYVDTRYDTTAFAVPHGQPERHIVKTQADYRRFAFTGSGISPRGIPGYGEGTVCADSDEHDESGHITEDLDLRVRMVDKRKEKARTVMADALPPTLEGPADYKTLVICWGSTFNTIAEAVAGLGMKDMSVLHFSWIFPLPEGIRETLLKASTLIVVENNSSSQFARLLTQETGIRLDRKILKYNGLPFSVEEVRKEILANLSQGEK